MRTIFLASFFAILTLNSAFAKPQTLEFESDKFEVMLPPGWRAQVTVRSKLSEQMELEPGQKDKLSNDRYTFYDEQGKAQAAFFWVMVFEDWDICPTEATDTRKKGYDKTPAGCGEIVTNEKGLKLPLYGYASTYVCGDNPKGSDTKYEERNLENVRSLCRSARKLKAP